MYASTKNNDTQKTDQNKIDENMLNLFIVWLYVNLNLNPNFVSNVIKCILNNKISIYGSPGAYAKYIYEWGLCRTFDVRMFAIQFNLTLEIGEQQNSIEWVELLCVCWWIYGVD